METNQNEEIEQIKNTENSKENTTTNKNKKKKILLIVIVISIVLLTITSCFLLFKGDIINDNSKNNSNNKNDETLVHDDLYGDVNCDGEVNQNDLDYLYKYIAEDPDYPLSDQAMKNANVYLDEKVNLKDFNALTNYLNKTTGYEKLPISPEVVTPPSTPEETTQPSSPEEITPPSTPEVVTLSGDVNCDGKVDQSDWDYLYKYITEDPNYPLSDQAMKNADINQDNKINIKDWNALYNYLNNK